MNHDAAYQCTNKISHREANADHCTPGWACSPADSLLHVSHSVLDMHTSTSSSMALSTLARIDFFFRWHQCEGPTKMCLYPRRHHQTFPARSIRWPRRGNASGEDPKVAVRGRSAAILRRRHGHPASNRAPLPCIYPWKR